MMIQDQDSINAAAGRYWSDRLTARMPERVRWWDDETTRRHINLIVIGKPLDGLHAGFHERIAEYFAGCSAQRAISVGCGIGSKEWNLVRMGTVEYFDLYDISVANVELGRKLASEGGLSNRICYHLADAFKETIPADYDLVYWNNALHHMPDAFQAVAWSYDRLRPSGLFAMDDFVGPTRFQWTDENLRWARSVRHNLPDRLLHNPWSPGTLVEREIVRESPETVIAVDPSEAVDSGRIVAAIKANFPTAEILPTGGAIYHLALNDIFCNFISEDDYTLLRQILMLDKLLAERGTTQYAVALAQKPEKP
jgi:SAM-dependent methyltransferase